LKPLGWIGTSKDDLHAFQKKSKTGIATPAKEMEKVRARLRLAEEEYERWRSAKR
jgi:phage-related protein